MTSTRIDRVYRYGCTRAPEEEALAIQLLGQAWLYREDLRRAYNRCSKDARALIAAKDDSAHVFSYLHDRKRAEIRDARAARGHLIDYGTYWLIEDAVAQAAKMSGLDPIKASRWEVTGRIGAAIQSVEQFPADAWEHKRVTLGEQNARKIALLTVRVGALARGFSITWPIKMHRPLPKGAIVKQVAMQRTRDGHRYRWEALVTVNFKPAQNPDADAEGVVGVDVGWRREAEAVLRVATHDGSGDAGVLRIDTVEAFLYADGVRARRDLNFDEAKEYVKRVGLPGTDHAHLWRDKDRLHRLNRRVTDLGVRWWIERDKHLEDIECVARTRAVRRRLDVFRTYADALAKRYRVIALEDMPMQDWVGESETHAKERRRSAAALSLLQTVLAERFGTERTDWVPAAGTSTTCSACGLVRLEPIGPAKRWTCECGAEHHQDENAAKVIRARSERWIGDGNLPRARTRKAKKKKEKKGGDGIATGDERKMVVTPREESSQAAE